MAPWIRGLWGVFLLRLVTRASVEDEACTLQTGTISSKLILQQIEEQVNVSFFMLSFANIWALLKHKLCCINAICLYKCSALDEGKLYDLVQSPFLSMAPLSRRLWGFFPSQIGCKNLR
ncbi:hypothetical protein SLE2022_345420 [Rubroshorea leprosula]